MTHGNAHEIVSGLESEIGHELGPGIEVETHIEPLEPRPLQGHDAPIETRAEIAHALRAKWHPERDQFAMCTASG